MLKEEKRFAASDILEGMTSISALLNSDGVNDRKIEKVLIDRSKRKSKAAQIGFLTAKSHERGFGVEFVDAEEIDRLSVGNTHGGILALCSARTIPALSVEDIHPESFYVYLEGIEDPYNFGYAIRSHFAAGVEGVILPERNWMTAAGVVARSSAGASEELPMFTSDAKAAVEEFKKRGYTVVCADLDTDDVLGECAVPYPILLIVGGERRGISKDVLSLADKKVKIEYARECRASLSAASATTMFAYEIMRQNKNK